MKNHALKESNNQIPKKTSKKSPLTGNGIRTGMGINYPLNGKNLLSSIKDAGYITDNKFRIVHWNKAAENLFGRTEKGAAGKLPEEIIELKHDFYNHKKLQQTLLTGNSVQAAVSIRSKSGKWKNVLLSAMPFFKGNKFSGVLVTFNQGQKKAHYEDASKLNDEKFRKIFENYPLMNFLVDSKGIVLNVNKNGAAELGYSPDELIGKSVKKVFLKQDWKIVRSHLRNCTNQTEKTFKWQLRKIHKNGSIIWVNETACAYNSSKGKTDVLIACENITESKLIHRELEENEKKFKTLFENANDAIFLMLEDIFIDCNNLTLKMFNCSRDEIIGKTPYDFSPAFQPDGNSSRELALEKISNALKGEPQFFYWKHKKATGELFDVEVSLNKISINDKIYLQAIVRDITTRLETEAKMNMLAHALKSITQIITVTDYQNNILFVNDAFLKTYNYTEKEILGANVTVIRSDKNPEGLYSEIKEGTKRGGWKGQIWNKSREGKEFLVSMSTSIVRDENRKPIALMSVAQDITEQKAAEEALKESEERFRLLVENMLDAVIIIDFKGNIKFANSASFKLIGLHDEVNSNKYNVTNFIHPDDFEKIQSDLSRFTEGNTGFISEYKIIDINGKEKWVEALGTAIKYKGKLSNLVTLRDITERKKSEEQLNLLFTALKSAANGVLISDREGNILWVNPAFTDLTGYELDEVVNKKSNLLKSNKMNKEFYSELWQTILKGNVWRGELINKRKDGTLYNEQMTITPVKTSSDQITHFIAIKEDISDRKKAMNELVRAKEQAEEMNRLKSRFLANMSHELRTPLVGILGFSELLGEELVEPKKREMADRILSNGKRLLETLNSLLDLSRIEANKIEINYSMVNIGSAVKNSIRLYEAFAASKKLFLKAEIIDSEVGASLDPQILNQILNNLINNAIKYTNEGGVTIKVDRTLYQGVMCARIIVSDTGIGIPEQSFDVIFQEFRQVSEGFGRQFEGTGLGLTITKKFVELMKGKIFVESKVGSGSSFTVLFPAYKTTFVSKKNEEKHQKKSVEENLDENNHILLPLVLLVEDDKVSWDITRIFLKNICVIELAENAESALEMVQKKKYDLILMDINLGPGMNGHEASKKIRELPDYKDVPIVALTAFVLEGDKERFLSSGCSHFIPKPFERSDFREKISTILAEIK
ncbi:MAG: PAS domain S-box protein [Ignavibacteriaceae bacterium]|nr:PAS domain S-box protein [Ignavibacteriaceae bacterium]